MHTLPFFVYGTLKRGHVRAPLWPHPPQRVLEAHTLGRLYDLGPYPALRDGSDRVRGELWFIAPRHTPETLEVLDRIECFGVDDVDLYVRREIDCWDAESTVHRAYAYFLADHESLDRRTLIAPGASGSVSWPADSD